MSKPSAFRIATALVRPLDINYASNRFVAVATILTALGTLTWRLITDADDPWLWALRAGTVVFVAWAIGRELDPDETLSGAVASLTVLPLLALGSPSLLASVAALGSARIAVRTTGVSPHILDGVVLTIGAGVLGALPETWPAMAALILAVGTDRFAEPPGPDRTMWFTATMVAAALLGAVVFADLPGWEQPTIAEWVAFAITAVAGFLAIVNTRPPRSRDDIHGRELSVSRLRFGRVIAAFTLVVGIIFLGGPTIPLLTPLWASAIGITAVRYYRELKRR